MNMLGIKVNFKRVSPRPQTSALIKPFLKMATENSHVRASEGDGSRPDRVGRTNLDPGDAKEEKKKEVTDLYIFYSEATVKPSDVEVASEHLLLPDQNLILQSPPINTSSSVSGLRCPTQASFITRLRNQRSPTWFWVKEAAPPPFFFLPFPFLLSSSYGFKHVFRTAPEGHGYAKLTAS